MWLSPEDAQSRVVGANSGGYISLLRQEVGSARLDKSAYVQVVVGTHTCTDVDRYSITTR